MGTPFRAFPVHRITEPGRWYLIKLDLGPDCKPQVWWAQKGEHQDFGPVWINVNGGFYPTRSNLSVLTSMEATSWHDLPKADTSLVQNLLDVDPDTKTGWLSPEGDFHPCRYYNHDKYALYILQKDVAELEKEGWARITEGAKSLTPLLGRGQELTEAQAAFLLDHIHGKEGFRS